MFLIISVDIFIVPKIVVQQLHVWDTYAQNLQRQDFLSCFITSPSRTDYGSPCD